MPLNHPVYLTTAMLLLLSVLSACPSKGEEKRAPKSGEKQAVAPPHVEEAPHAETIVPDAGIAKTTRPKAGPLEIVEIYEQPKGLYELDDGGLIRTLVAFDTPYSVSTYCNVNTKINPDELRLLRITGRDELIYLCPGDLDGAENVLTLFSPHAPPATKAAMPPRHQNALSKAQLAEIVTKMLK